MSSSWVIMTTVRPCACSLVKADITSTLEAGVEIAGGLVGQDQRRIGHNGTSHGDPLLLAAGHLARKVVHAFAKPHGLERGLALWPGVSWS